MLSYMFRRLALMVLVLFGITVVTFVISHLIPADPALLAAGPNATYEQASLIRERLGLDQPLYIQYGKYLNDVLHGDLGRSIRTRHSINEDLRKFVPATLELVAVTIVLYTMIGIALGVATAFFKGKSLDELIRLLAVASAAVPPFWLAIMLQVVFYGALGWFPSTGRIGLEVTPPPNVTGLFLIDSVLAGDWQAFQSTVMHLALPVLTLFLGRMAILLRVTRRELISSMNQDYVRTARAKGVHEARLIWSHGLRNTLVPLITLIGLQFGWLFNGTLLIEIIFSWPGIGLYAVTAVHFLDFQAIMGVTLFVSVVFVIVNFLVDISYVYVDPRIRY